MENIEIKTPKRVTFKLPHDVRYITPQNTGEKPSTAKRRLPIKWTTIDKNWQWNALPDKASDERLFVEEDMYSERIQVFNDEEPLVPVPEPEVPTRGILSRIAGFLWPCAK